MSDMPAKTEEEKKAISAQAWQIKFHRATDDATTGVIEVTEPQHLFAKLFHRATDDTTTGAIEVTEPRHLFAKLCPIDAADVLAESPEFSRSFVIVWVPPGVKASVSIEHDAEAWVRDGQVAGKIGVVRAGVRTVRIFWTFSRALIYASAENIDSALNAVVRFTVAQRETIELEDEMGATWSEIDADAPLTHSITVRQQRRQSHVNEMTVRAVRMKAKFLRITRALEQRDPSLDESSKRIYAELVLAVALYDRLELLENPVQFALDHYEIANTRLSEARFALEEQRSASLGHLLEALIILLLFYPLHLFW